MIIRSSFRGPGGLVAHLRRSDTNERVVVRDDLSPEGADNIETAIRDYLAMTSTLSEDTKPLVHLILSPSQPLSREQERVAIERVRTVYGVNSTHPMLVVQHRKPGNEDRADHYHLVLPRCDPEGPKNERGRPQLIRDSFSFVKNERLSIEIAHDLGHDLVIGPHMASVERVLAVERPDIFAALTASSKGDVRRTAVTVGDKSQAVDTAIDLAAFDRRALDAFEAKAFAENGLSIARGERSVMIVDDATGFSQSILRVLNRESKRRKAPLNLTKADLSDLIGYPDMSLADVKRQGIRRALDSSTFDITDEFRAGRLQAIRDVDASTLKELVVGEVEEKGRQAEHAQRAKATLKADLEELARRHGMSAALRRKRVQRRSTVLNWTFSAFKLPSRVAFSVVKTTMEMKPQKQRHNYSPPGPKKGISEGEMILGMQLSVILYVLPPAIIYGLAIKSAELAMTYALTASEKRREERYATERDDLLERVRSARGFDLRSIPKQGRIAAGCIYRAISEGEKPDQKVMDALDELKPGLSGQIADVAIYGLSVKVGDVFRKMYDPDVRTHVVALQRFLSGPERSVQLERSRASRGIER